MELRFILVERRWASSFFYQPAGFSQS